MALFNCLVIDLPEGTEQYSEDINLFVDLMLEKLHKHRNKGHWENVNINDMWLRLVEEVDELFEAMYEGDSTEIHREAADVANFAMIISSVIRRREQDNDDNQD